MPSFCAGPASSSRIATSARSRCWVNPATSAQPDDGRHGPRVDDARRSAAARIPACCKEGSDNKYAQYFPLATASAPGAATTTRRPKEFTLIDTCFGTHHLQFAEDADNTLVLQRRRRWPIGWINTKLYDQTERRAGLAGLVSDGPRHQRRRQDHQAVERAGERGAGGREDRATAGGRLDPKLDTRVPSARRTASSSTRSTTRSGASTDESTRASSSVSTRGSNPPRDAASPSATRLPQGARLPAARHRRRSQRRDLDGARRRAASMASFDRRKCKVLNGPATTTGGTAGRLDASIRCRVRRSRARRSAPTSTITTGSISSTRSASARTCRSPTARTPIRCSCSCRRRRSGSMLRVPYPDGLPHPRAGRPDRRSEAGWKGRGI